MKNDGRQYSGRQQAAAEGHQEYGTAGAEKVAAGLILERLQHRGGGLQGRTPEGVWLRGKAAKKDDGLHGKHDSRIRKGADRKRRGQHE